MLGTYDLCCSQLRYKFKTTYLVVVHIIKNINFFADTFPMTNLLKQFNLPKNPKRVGNRPVENSALTYFGRLASSIVRTFTKYFNIYSITEIRYNHIN